MIKQKDIEIENDLLIQYKRVTRVGKFGKYVKSDLHVHTPASKKCYLKVNKKNDEITEYNLLIERFIESDVKVIAITDHNTIEGYYKIKEIIDSNAVYKSSLSDKLILPGVEITCYGKHFIVIFPESIKMEKLNLFLLDCGISAPHAGDSEESADRVTPITLCEKVAEYSGILLIAHCDAENGLLLSYFEKSKKHELKGQSVIKVLKSPAVHGIFYNSDSNLPRLIDLLNSNNLNHVQLLQASDSHSSMIEYTNASGVPFGSRASWIKLGELSYKALRLALRNNITKILCSMPEKEDNLFLLGIAVKGGFFRHIDKNIQWSIFPFSDELNCIIGARGTGKSTLLDIVRFVLDNRNIELGNKILQRFDESIVYVNIDKIVYAFYLSPYFQSNLRRYKFNNGKFKPITNKLTIGSSQRTPSLSAEIYFSTKYIQCYAQKELLNLAASDIGPTSVIQGLCSLKYGKEFADTYDDMKMYESNVIANCKELIKDRHLDKKADYTSDYLESNFKSFLECHNKILEYHKQTVDELNSILSDKIKLHFSLCIPLRIANEIISNLIKGSQYSIYYEEQKRQEKFLHNLFNNYSDNWAFPFYLFTRNALAISETCNIPLPMSESLCIRYSRPIRPSEVVMQPYYLTDFDLNVNHGMKASELFVPRNKLSFGQKSVGMLLLILHGATELGEKRPLLIDQPEDDLDNSYVYHSLVKELYSIKSKRQLIIATHNPNIPIAGDAENIISLQSDGQNGWLDLSGTIDNKNVSERVLKILEGDFEAFSRRAEKYGFRLEKSE